MPSELATRICKNCGREIPVPAELSVFSCVYCGAKLSLADYAAPACPADPADLALAEAHILDCVRDYPDAFKHFNRKQYEPFYQTYQEAVAPAFAAMDRWVCAHPEERQALLEGFAARFLDQWEDFHQNHPKARSKRAKEKLAFSNKLTLALFAVPAIRGLGLSISADFPRLLQERFREKYPENTFELATYEEIRSGFRKPFFLFGK